MTDDLPPQTHDPFQVPPQVPLVAPPPVIPDGPAGGGKKEGGKKAGAIATLLAALAAKAKAVLAGLSLLLKFGFLGKILLTSGTMLLSIWVYTRIFGFWFAVGFVILILVHEMGHVALAAQQGVKVSAPVFIPFFGALILASRGETIQQGAIIGIGGPAMGTLGSIACLAVFATTGSTFFLGLAFVGFFLNLFNLTPIYPLDGGWIVRAISPVLWLVGVLALVVMLVMGWLRNPFIIVLLILGIPTMWREMGAFFRREPSTIPASFRWNMGLAYVGLMAVCAFGMAWCNMQFREPAPPPPSQRHRAGTQLAVRPLPPGHLG